MATPVSREPTGAAKSWPVPGLQVSVAISPACWRSTQATNRGVQDAVMKGLVTVVG